MDVVLANIQYNPECFSEINDDFEEFDDIKKTPDCKEEDLIFPKITNI